MKKKFDVDIPPIISWDAPAAITHEKGRLWYIIAGIIVLMVVVYFLITDSILPAVTFLLAAGVYYMAQNTNVSMQKIELNNLGIKVNMDFYPYSSIESFWIIYNPPYTKTLNFLVSRKTGSRKIAVQLHNQKPSEVRSLLRHEIPEIQGKGESFSEMMTKVLKI